jgi:hypothetical protein
MLIEQTNHVGVEAIEAPDLLNDLSPWRHTSIIQKTLDFVKYFDRGRAVRGIDTGSSGALEWRRL